MYDGYVLGIGRFQGQQDISLLRALGEVVHPHQLVVRVGDETFVHIQGGFYHTSVSNRVNVEKWRIARFVTMSCSQV